MVRLDPSPTSAARRVAVATRTAAYLTLATPRHVAEGYHAQRRRTAGLVAVAGAVLIAGFAVVAAAHREDPAEGAASAAGPAAIQPGPASANAEPAAATMACQAI